MTASRLRSFAAGAAVLLVLLGAGRVVFLGVPTRPPIVASVDIERLFNNLDFRTTEIERIETMAAGFDQQLEEIRAQIEDYQAELENFEQGGEAWVELSRKAEAAISEYQAIEQFGRLKIEAERAKTIKSVYEQIRTEVAAFCQEQSPAIDYVFVDDTIADFVPTSAENMQKQIAGRRLLYTAEAFDITDAMLARMNGTGG